MSWSSDLLVPFSLQEEKFTCEIATLKMVLNFYKIPVTEKELKKQMPIDQTPKSINAKSEMIWGDPNLGFVGKTDGKNTNESYGIHWNPILDMAKKYRPAYIIRNSNLIQLKTILNKGHPIILWGAPKDSKKLVWKTPLLKTIEVKENEHTQIVIGMQDQFITLLDPAYHKKVITQEMLLDWWEAFQFTGLVIE